MLAEERQKRQENLIDKIQVLSKNLFENETEIRRMALKLKEVYSSDFRHSYSEFFPAILDINQSSDGNLDFLAENLERLRNYVEEDFITGKNEFTEMHKSFDKLCDHLNLEISRVRYSSQNDEKTNDLSRRLETAREEMNTSTKKLSKASKKAESIQTELISVVSVFSAIVISFSGSLSFIGSAINGIRDTYICKMILTLLICGFILFNTTFLLMYLVGKIIGRSILADCESEKCDCKNGEKPKCAELKKIRKRLPYVFYFNIVIILFTIIDILVWLGDKELF
ncbi:hypothetical protein DS742_19130 [Lacrimispora amygdalina]|uniref:Uncharacterized protein n=1 Tax=Lacrimispora amygdalina TaxID=253257 RepID=A0A3E2N8I8_9FIRM|nr:hypothetical protein [Clostridium indicum]RFZ77306.1 hypothetical protein DS742_19130 [Clostridium indicum]